MRTMTRERIAAMARVALTDPGSEVGLYAIEQDLAQQGVPTGVVTEHFDDLHAARHFRSTPGSLR